MLRILLECLDKVFIKTDMTLLSLHSRLAIGIKEKKKKTKQT